MYSLFLRVFHFCCFKTSTEEWKSQGLHVKLSSVSVSCRPKLANNSEDIFLSIKQSAYGSVDDIKGMNPLNVLSETIA